MNTPGVVKATKKCQWADGVVVKYGIMLPINKVILDERKADL